MTTEIIPDYVNAFNAAMERAATAIQDAARILVEALDQDPDAINQIAATTRWTRRTLLALERVGRKQLHPGLFGLEGPAFTKLARCNYSEQERFLHERIPVLIFDNGQADELLVAIDDLAPQQIEQVFARSHVRDLAAQRAWLNRRPPAPARKAEAAAPYTIRKGKVHFHRFEGELTTAQLMQLAQQSIS